MDLTLDVLGVRLNGRKARELGVVEEGELTLADLGALAEEGHTKPPSLKHLSERHHGLARLLASGVSNEEAAYAYSYKPGRVSILLQDEAFKELVEHYRAIPEAAYADLHTRLAGMSIDAADEVMRRMEADANRDEGEAPKIAMGQLLAITQMGADRTGHGPATSATHLHLHGGLAERLEAARKRVAAMRDITPKEVEDDEQNKACG